MSFNIGDTVKLINPSKKYEKIFMEVVVNPFTDSVWPIRVKYPDGSHGLFYESELALVEKNMSVKPNGEAGT